MESRGPRGTGRMKITSRPEEHYQVNVYNLPADESLLAYVQKYGSGADTAAGYEYRRLEDVLPLVAQKVTEMYVSQQALRGSKRKEN
ncbi:hypothetical protein NPIL_484381 [Nephila pilipes]|uniref:Uncharacterized protein n=1 Tax=Nephila pilipes TaxID=299642 RepID=A0A8X6PYB1_NEPPI|nr:hypothetical protein NPIL_484381 [Nephila pilipes]